MFGRLKSFLVLWRQFSVPVVKLHSSFLRGYFAEKNFLNKNVHFQNHFRTLSATFSDFWQQVFGRVVKFAIFLTGETLWRKNFFWKYKYLLNHFETVSKKGVGWKAKKISAGLSKAQWTCPVETSEGKNIVSRNLIFLKIFYWLWTKHFRIFLKKNWWDCQLCIMRVQKSVLSKTHTSRNLYFSSSFGHWANWMKF